MAFSPATGLTVLLNDESAAILEALDGAPLFEHELAARLVGGEDMDANMDADMAQAHRALADGWPTLIDSGLVFRVDATA